MRLPISLHFCRCWFLDGSQRARRHCRPPIAIAFGRELLSLAYQRQFAAIALFSPGVMLVR
jgi:hypothetical protein